jgi:hypothetical protein
MTRTSGNYSPQMQEAIRRRATELYQQRGALEGRDEENWYQAEAEILHGSVPHLARRAVVVNFQGGALHRRIRLYLGRWLHSWRMEGRRPPPRPPLRRQTVPPPPQRPRTSNHRRKETRLGRCL